MRTTTVGASLWKPALAALSLAVLGGCGAARATPSARASVSAEEATSGDEATSAHESGGEETSGEPTLPGDDAAPIDRAELDVARQMDITARRSEESSARRSMSPTVASQLRECELVASGAFVPRGEMSTRQRLWACPNDATVVIEDGVRVVYEDADFTRDTELGELLSEMATFRAALLRDLTGDETQELVVDVFDREVCVAGLLVLAWEGAALEVIWERLDVRNDCLTEWGGVDVEGVSDWWPARYGEQHQPPSLQIVNTDVIWFDAPAVWTGSEFRPAAAALARWRAQRDAEVARLIVEGQGAHAIHLLREDAPDALRTSAEAACEEQILRAIAVAPTAPVDPMPEYAPPPPTPLVRAQWGVMLSQQGLRCGRRSQRMREAMRHASENLVLALAAAGQDFRDALRGIDDEDERRRVEARALEVVPAASRRR